MKTDTKLMETWNKKCSEEANGKIGDGTLAYYQLTPKEKIRIFDLIKQEAKTK